MPTIPQDSVVQFLMWACGVLGSGLIASLIFIAVGVMSKLTSIEKTADEQFSSFGRQLASVHDSMVENIHEHEVRLVRLEEWRRARDKEPVP